MEREILFKNLSKNTKDFWIQNSLPSLINPSIIEFLHEGVLNYHPVIINELTTISHWNAWKNWNFEYFQNKLGDKKCLVNFTPNGLADCVIKDQSTGNPEPPEYFYYPIELEISMKLFLEMLLHPQEDDAIPYLSQQNNNFVTSFPELANDIDLSMQLGEEAFRSKPEAVNIWIGDERSVSSLHKDHFENLYVVITGEKVFTLYPPTDIVFFGESKYSTKTYQFNGTSPISTRPKKNEFISTNDACPAPELPWIGVDPERPDAHDVLPSLKYSSPIQVRVSAGEILYIPSMWYHRVTQSCPTIAINYWYEQSFNFRYVFYSLARKIAPTICDQEIDSDTDVEVSNDLREKSSS